MDRPDTEEPVHVDEQSAANPPEPSRGGEERTANEPDDRILTIPNLLTFLRILLLPVFLWLLVDGRYLEAGVLFVLIAFTDFLDGRIARRYGQVTKLGTMLDPVADRLLIVTAAIAVVIRGLMPLWLVALLLVREVWVSLWAIFLKSRGVQIDVRLVGKWSATLIFASVPAFILADVFPEDSVGRAVFYVGGILVGVVGVGLGFVTNAFYMVDGREALAAARAMDEAHERHS